MADFEIKVKRIWNYPEECAIGKIYTPSYEFYTLEDPVREGEKIWGKTAIPVGRYRVIIDWSNRFQKLMPLICEVPNFTGIRVHSGNTAEDTTGCILVGMEKGNKRVINSRVAYNKLFSEMKSENKQGKMWITITNEFET